MAERKSTLSIAGRQTESSSELANGIGEYFKNRLNLSAYIVVGISKDSENIPFALDGSTEDLGTLLRIILRMSPIPVQKATLKAELKAQYKEEAEKILKDL
jgi:hypothetical protein